MLNRELSPVFAPIKKLSIQHPESITFSNGLQTFLFQSSEIELIKFEFVFNNHFDEHTLPLINPALSALLKEGTGKLTSAQIADEVDFYGAYLMSEYSFDHTAISLYTMRKYADKVLPIIFDIVSDAVFPVRELETYVRNQKQSLQISLTKNDFLARRYFYENLFGNNRYGTVPTIAAFDAIDRDSLLSLYQKQIQPQNCTLFIAGNVSAEVMQLVSDLFGQQWNGKAAPVEDHFESITPKEALLIYEDKPEALQSAIRLGCLAIRRSHEDYPALQFVNTLLGGFFGSRLMRNIREDKGYTYSIGSAVASLKHTGFFTVASEVGVQVTQNTLAEIEKEFTMLQNEKASVEEIELVRNYMQGVLLGSLESIFSHVDKFKSVYFSGMDLSYYDYYTDVIQNINADTVQQIAQKYFHYDSLLKVVVGKME